MSELEGRVAVVTGGGSGIGRAMAESFAAQGMRLVIADIDAAAAERTATELRKRGTSALAVRTDVTKRESLDELADRTYAELGACNALCANAGVLVMGPLDEATAEDWEWIFSVNVMGVVHTVQAFLPALRRQADPRHILITVSTGALFCAPGTGVYTASKHALLGYGETLRQELATEGIGVSLLLPSSVRTNILDSGRHRPPELGSALVSDEAIAQVASATDSPPETLVAPDFAVRHVFAALCENQPWIITSALHRALAQRRHDEILRAFERAES